MLDAADAANWRSLGTAAGCCRYWEKDGLHHVTFCSDDDVDMEVVHKTAPENFSDTVENFDRLKPWKKVIINGCFGENSIFFGDTYLNQIIMGDVIENKKKTVSYVTGHPRAYLSFENSSASYATVYAVGMGSPPMSADAAIGGLCPLLVKGKKYDKSHDFYNTLLARSPNTGKVVFGQSADRFQYIGVQPDKVGSLNVDQVRDRMAAAGMEDAILLDGSDSAMLFVGGSWKVRQSAYKNKRTIIGVCFFG